MFDNIKSLDMFIFAAIFGIIAAVIYSNISNKLQRKFIEYLKNNSVYEEANAVTLSKMGISGFGAFVLNSKLNSSRVLKEYIGTVMCDEGTDKLEQMLSKAESQSFYLKRDDIDSIAKNYISQPLTFKQLLISIIALILSGFILIFGIDKAVSCASANDKEETTETVTESSEEKDSTEDKDETESELPSNDENVGPTIPMMPQKTN